MINPQWISLFLKGRLGKANKYNICLQEFRNNLFKVDDESKENSLDLKMAFSINIVLGIFQP